MPESHIIICGRAKHTDVAKGVAMAEEHDFVKVVVEEKTGKILGSSAIGAGASKLIQKGGLPHEYRSPKF